MSPRPARRLVLRNSLELSPQVVKAGVELDAVIHGFDCGLSLPAAELDFCKPAQIFGVAGAQRNSLIGVVEAR